MKEGLVLAGLATTVLLAADVVAPPEVTGIAGELGRLGLPGLVIAMMAWYIRELTRAREESARRHEEVLTKMMDGLHDSVSRVGEGFEMLAKSLERIADRGPKP